MSRKPTALAFQDWVKDSLLPSIRKHGAYIAGQEKVAASELGEDEFIAAALQLANRKLN